MTDLNQMMQEASRKAAQAQMLLDRVTVRLKRTKPALLPQASDFVLMFFLCLEEMQKIRAENPDDR